MHPADASQRLPGALVAALALDGVQLMFPAFYIVVFAIGWRTLDLVGRLEAVALVLLVAAIVLAMVGLVRRKPWARALNALAVCSPAAFFVAVAVTAGLNLAGVGKPDITAGLGMFYSLVALFSLAPFVAVTCALLYAGPGVREWLRISPPVPAVDQQAKVRAG